MPNTTQLDLLLSFIGKDGSTIKSIIEHEGYDLGTKILYLQRAIKEERLAFRQSLNKLGTPVESNKKFINALKLINGFCFNNKVTYQSRTRQILEYCFSALGEVEPIHFQRTTRAIIYGIIRVLSQGREIEIALQTQARIAAETDISLEDETIDLEAIIAARNRAIMFLADQGMLNQENFDSLSNATNTTGEASSQAEFDRILSNPLHHRGLAIIHPLLHLHIISSASESSAGEESAASPRSVNQSP